MNEELHEKEEPREFFNRVCLAMLHSFSHYMLEKRLHEAETMVDCVHRLGATSWPELPPEIVSAVWFATASLQCHIVVHGAASMRKAGEQASEELIHKLGDRVFMGWE